MNAIDFYKTTETMLNQLSKMYGVKEIERYYELTAYSKGSVFNDFSGTAQIFALVAFHAQDASWMSNIVKFEKNINFLRNVCCDFKPDEFLYQYPYEKLDGSILRLVDALRYNDFKKEVRQFGADNTVW